MTVILRYIADIAVGLRAEAIVQLTNEYQSQGVASVAISSNSILTHPQDGPEEMAQDARSLGAPRVGSVCNQGSCLGSRRSDMLAKLQATPSLTSTTKDKM